jgi:hypothetical protein
MDLARAIAAASILQCRTGTGVDVETCKQRFLEIYSSLDTYSSAHSRGGPVRSGLGREIVETFSSWDTNSSRSEGGRGGHVRPHLGRDM